MLFLFYFKSPSINNCEHEGKRVISCYYKLIINGCGVIMLQYKAKSSLRLHHQLTAQMVILDQGLKITSKPFWLRSDMSKSW